MNAITKSEMQDGRQQQSGRQKSDGQYGADDPRETAITSLLACLSTDYASQFTQAYPDAKAVEVLRSRLARLFDGLDPRAIIQAYDECVSQTPKYLPSVPELAQAAKAADGEIRRSAEAHATILHHAALPKPKVDGLAKIKALQDAAAERPRMSPEEFQAALAKHDELIEAYTNTGRVKTITANNLQRCGVPGCKLAGTMSSNTTGSDRWYCFEHFKGQA